METRVRRFDGHIGSRIAWTTFCFPALQESPDMKPGRHGPFRISSIADRPPRKKVAFFALDEPPPRAALTYLFPTSRTGRHIANMLSTGMVQSVELR
jgi:hypothetical protein